MTEHNYTLVEGAVVEGNLGALRSLREALAQSGIRKVHPFQTGAGLTEALSAQQPDLLVIDVDAPELDGFQVIRWLRTDPASPNPFLCILATSWQPTEALLHKVDNAGADALLVKPTSPKQMAGHIHTLLEARKRFTVSADYIGPDRRKKPREGVLIPSLEAPNTLRLKVGGHWDRPTTREEIAKALAWINEQKAKSDAFQIAFYVDVAKPGLARTPPDRMAFDLVLKISGLADDLLRRSAVGAGNRSLALETAARAAMALVDRVRRRPDRAPPATDLDELQTLSHSLMTMVNPDRLPESLEGEVAEAASAYRRRLDQILAAKAEAAKP